MDLIQSFITIAEAAAKREAEQKNADSHAEVQPKLPSLEVVQQPQSSKVMLHVLETKKEATA